MNPERGSALEIASGTGQHVVWFAAGLPDWHWQPTDAAVTAVLADGVLTDCPLAVRRPGGEVRDVLVNASLYRDAAGTVLRVTSGNFMEMFDFFLFGFYATAISKAFFPAGDEVAARLPPWRPAPARLRAGRRAVAPASRRAGGREASMPSPRPPVTGLVCPVAMSSRARWSRQCRPAAASPAPASARSST